MAEVGVLLMVPRLPSRMDRRFHLWSAGWGCLWQGFLPCCVSWFLASVGASCFLLHPLPAAADHRLQNKNFLRTNHNLQGIRKAPAREKSSR